MTDTGIFAELSDPIWPNVPLWVKSGPMPVYNPIELCFRLRCKVVPSFRENYRLGRARNVLSLSQSFAVPIGR